jgi:hypothetical protein
VWRKSLFLHLTSSFCPREGQQMSLHSADLGSLCLNNP